MKYVEICWKKKKEKGERNETEERNKKQESNKEN